MSARRPCCVGFICVLVYLVGGVAAAAAVAAARQWLLLWQRLHRFQCRCPDGGAAWHFCRSVKRRASESVPCVRAFGSGPRTGKASMCQGYCEISRELAPACLKQPDSPNYQKKLPFTLEKLEVYFLFTPVVNK